jgi:hypothetical protein
VFAFLALSSVENLLIAVHMNTPTCSKSDCWEDAMLRGFAFLPFLKLEKIEAKLEWTLPSSALLSHALYLIPRFSNIRIGRHPCPLCRSLFLLKLDLAAGMFSPP